MPVKALTESSDNYIFFATAKNQITYFQNSEKGICDLPPFYFPIKGDSQQNITTLWFDKENNLYIGATNNTFYIVPKAGTDQSLNPKNYKIGKTNDDKMLIEKGELPVQKVFVGSGIGVYAFAENGINKNIVWVGTSKGLYTYNKNTREINRVISSDSTITITHIEALNNGDIWFSTLEKGMGVYNQTTGKQELFSYPKQNASVNTLYPVQSFCIKSPDDFFVAVKDSTPAIFNTANHLYKFLNDTSFVSSKNNTTGIKVDSAENFYLSKVVFYIPQIYQTIKIG